jgi:O-antigen/teichoic acid export membrane protein
LKGFIDSFKKSVFLRNVSILVSGTAISQAIPLLTSPLITRLYEPASFGVFAVYVSMVSILITIATGRYEKAIVIPDDIETSKKLTVLSQVLILLFTGLLFFTTFLFGEIVLTSLNLGDLIPFMYLLPIGVLIMASDQSIYHWANKIEKYGSMSLSKIVNNVSSGTLQIVFGLLHLETIGLIFSKLAGLVASFLFMIRTFVFSDFLKYTSSELKLVAKRFIKFPTYLMSAHLLNTMALNSPPIILAFYFNSVEVGFFGLTQRAIMLPVSIISRSVGDVFRQKASEHFHQQGNCRKLYNQTLLSLSVIGLIPFFILLFLSPMAFSFVFGTEWETAGVYAQILAVLFLFQFIVGPLSNLFMIAEKQKLELFWQITFFLSSTLSIFVGYYIFKTITGALIIFAISRSLSYILGLYLTSRLTTKQL